MNEEKKRYSTACSLAIVVHVIAFLIVGVLGFTFDRRPPQILEVSLAGGPPPKKGAANVVKQDAPKEKKAVIKPKVDDIVEKKETAPEPQTEQTTNANTAPAQNIGDPNGSDRGVEKGTGTNPDAKGEGPGAGGPTSNPATPPRISYTTRPHYPDEARKRNLEGVVYIKLLVNDSGGVDDAQLSSSSGYSFLDDSAVAAVYKWRFHPAKDAAGKKIPCYITIPVRFSLR